MVIMKLIYWLHNKFPTKIPIMSCSGCLPDTYDKCPHKATKKNLICYYHTKKDRTMESRWI